MAEDEIQNLLAVYYEHGDTQLGRNAGNRAFLLLKREWLHKVARFVHRDVMSADTEDMLSQVLIELLKHVPGRPPRALAPSTHDNPSAWRRCVLRNELLDAWRHQRPRLAAEQAVRNLHGDRNEPLPGNEAERNTAKLRPLLDPDATPYAEPVAEHYVALKQMRGLVIAKLKTLPIQRRIAVSLVLDVDISPWLPELAAALGEDSDVLRERVFLARNSSTSRKAEEEASGGAFVSHLSDAQVRILYPTESLDKARESLRKTLERATKDLQAAIVKGAS